MRETRESRSRSGAGDEPEPAGDDGPTTLRLAVLLLWVEAAGLAVLGVVELVKLVAGESRQVGSAVILTSAVLLAAGVLWHLARSLVRRRAWARGPAVALQLMALPVAFFMITGEGEWGTKVGGVLIGLVAVVGVSLLLTPSARAALVPR